MPCPLLVCSASGASAQPHAYAFIHRSEPVGSPAIIANSAEETFDARS